jgi:hypothetical protein
VVHAQDTDNRRSRALVIRQDTTQVDSVSLVPGSLLLLHKGVPVDSAQYTVDPWHARIIRRGALTSDTLVAHYRVMPLLLAGPFQHKDRARLLDQRPDRPDPFKYIPGKGANDPLGITGLNRTGSISRGVLFGNNQDLSVNSALNLELSGRLTDRIQVLASITDNNIPIQAGGNTAELQDFDRVFIKLFDERQELIAGDFVLERPRSHFLTWFKKTKGVGYSTLLGPLPGDSLGRGPRGTLAISAAVSKGKFARNVIQGIEGVQGPYRLSSSEGGSFIIVLSGTERVYIDGQLLTRGQENDYIIDYNTAEVTFTARRLITKDRRIVVEFQFSDKNYARSLVRLSNSWTLRRTEVNVDLYTEQDSRNQPLQQTLSDDDRRVLSEAGDDPLAATTNGADSVGWSVDQVLYARRDSLGYDPVYVYSTEPASALYRVVFSVVGPGSGDYVQDQFTPNGRVFKWVAPDTIAGALVRRGDHAPVRVLIPPRAQRMAEIGVRHRFTERARAWSHVALSDYDRNTFSSTDDGDNGGVALRFGGEQDLLLSRVDTSLRLSIGTDNEVLQRTFQQLERFRAVEFERNWNLSNPQTGLPPLVPSGDQLLAAVYARLSAGRRGRARITGSTFQVPDQYEGYRQTVEADLRPGRYELQFDGSALTSSAQGLVSDFLRHKGRYARRTGRLVIGLRDDQERNRFRADSSGALVRGSYSFYDWEAFVQSLDTAALGFQLSGGQRYEQALRGTALAASTEATSFTGALSLRADPRKRVGARFTYRSLQVMDSTITAARPEDTWLARLENDLTLARGAVRLSAFYELGSGLEQRREFIYLQVPAGQGTYIWIDYNGNGLKELNEFEVANFGYEADHIRAYTQTNRYVRVYNNQLSASLDLRPGAIWSEGKGFTGFLGKWTDMASIRAERKTGSGGLEDALDPFRYDPADTALAAFSSSLRNTIYYDRSGRVWSIDHSHQSDRNRSLLLNGFETRGRRSDIVHVRWNTTRQWTVEVEAERGRSTSSSDLLSGRTFAIEQQAGKGKVSWQPNTSLRISSQYKHTGKTNQAELGGETATIRDLGMELRWNTAGKGSLQVNANVVDITFDGATNSPLGNEMLTGLKPGTNGTWSVAVQRRLSGNLQLDLTYNGRRSEGTPTVHVGGAQVRAFF